MTDAQAPPAAVPLEAARCALVVVDIQEKLLSPIFNREQLVRNAALLIRLAGILELPVLVTTQYARGLGETTPAIAALLQALPTPPSPIDKVEFGCFGVEPFCAAMKALPGNRNTVLLTGMETHICVMQTALGALAQGYLVHVAADAVGSRAKLNWQIGLQRMRDAGCVISSTEMMIYELLRRSGSDAFKRLLPFLKG